MEYRMDDPIRDREEEGCVEDQAEDRLENRVQVRVEDQVENQAEDRLENWAEKTITEDRAKNGRRQRVIL